jgi:hypothetical protein
MLTVSLHGPVVGLVVLTLSWQVFIQHAKAGPTQTAKHIKAHQTTILCHETSSSKFVKV